MSFVDDLFKRQPGGTAFGNIMREVAGKLTNGAFGNGANMISQQEADLRDLSDEQYVAKYATTKAGQKVPGVTPDPSIMTQAQYAAYLASQKDGVAGAAAKNFLSKNILWIVLSFGLVLAWPKLKKMIR